VTWHPKRSYDLFIGHGGINYEHISRQLAENTVRIYFSTGIYWKDFNVREAKRFFDLANRRGYFLPADRAIIHSEEFANQCADGIIALGGNDSLRTYSCFPCVIGINCAAYPVTWRAWSRKDYQAGRQHFLFFSGDGNVHKGLDLLLEAFIRTDLHLHICQRMEPAFSLVYHRELTSYPNIHAYNYVKMRSPEFKALTNRCNWIISATCAEGSPGAVIECMAHGLIPILPESANLDMKGWGFRIPDCSVEAIRNSMLQASFTDPDECKQRSMNVFELAKDLYSVEEFRASFKRAIERIISNKKMKMRGQ
ncbi:MAG: hypothetical protein LUQ65_08140, partial [Candidatus Helarchaeota archaeon]|nr:hypothetical protein [Candidatus Helarchaeota archaeon]